MPHQGRTGEPWIDENRECSWSAIEAWRGWRTIVGWGEGDKEGRVTVELSDSDRHDERAEVWIVTGSFSIDMINSLLARPLLGREALKNWPLKHGKSQTTGQRIMS